VTNSVVGQNFNLGSFNAGDSLVFKIVADSETFYSAMNMNAGSTKHMYLLPSGSNKWQMRWAVSGNKFQDMSISVTN
jgi:hypothetical protein